MKKFTLDKKANFKYMVNFIKYFLNCIKNIA